MAYGNHNFVPLAHEIRNVFTRFNFRYKNQDSGWLQIAPVPMLKVNSVKLKTFTFPRYHVERYSIGSSSDNDFVLPSSTNEKIPEIMIHVENEEIKMLNISSDIVLLNELPLEKNTCMMIDIPKNENFIAKLKFGPYDYTLCKAPVTNFVSEVSNISKCVVCQNRWIDSRPLPCGHIGCQICVNNLTNRALDAADRANQLQLFRQNTAPLYFEVAKIKCPKCLQLTPINDIAEVPVIPELDKISERLYWLVSNRKMCADCDNIRCVAGSWDYWECYDCKRFICPVCALERHRTHNVHYLYMEIANNFIKFWTKGMKGKMNFRELKSRHTTYMEALQSAKVVLSICDDQLRQAESKITSVTKSAKELYLNLTALEEFRADGNVEAERIETLKNFQHIVPTVSKNLTPATTVFKKKVCYFRQIESKFLPLNGYYPEI